MQNLGSRETSWLQVFHFKLTLKTTEMCRVTLIYPNQTEFLKTKSMSADKKQGQCHGQFALFCVIYLWTDSIIIVTRCTQFNLSHWPGLANLFTSDFTNEVTTETLSSVEWGKREFDLANYVGQTIRIAWRHHDVTDMCFLSLVSTLAQLRQ